MTPEQEQEIRETRNVEAAIAAYNTLWSDYQILLERYLEVGLQVRVLLIVSGIFVLVLIGLLVFLHGSKLIPQ